MNRHHALLVLLPTLLFSCKKQEAINIPAPANVDSARTATSIPADTSSLTSIRYLQLLRSEDSSSYYTQDDCRCVQSTATFSTTGELSFARCDSIHEDSRYAIKHLAKDSTGLTIFATHLDTTDTIGIHRIKSNPVIYEIRRSNYSEIEAGNLFIDAKDSAKFEHHDWDCEEYQG